MTLLWLLKAWAVWTGSAAVALTLTVAVQKVLHRPPTVRARIEVRRRRAVNVNAHVRLRAGEVHSEPPAALMGRGD